MLWRVRTTLTDRPGSLARIAAACGEHGLNILAVQVFPEIGRVVDEVVVEAEESWSASDVATLVVAAGGDGVGVTSCDSRDLVDEPIRWLRAAERLLRRPSEQERVLLEVTGREPEDRSFSENARIAVLLDVLRAGATAAAPPAPSEEVVYEVLADAVLAHRDETVVGTASLAPDGTVTVVVAPTWRRRGVGRSLFRMMAGVARHTGLDEVVLVAPGDDLSAPTSDGAATLAMLDSMGLRGLVRLHAGCLQIRVSLADVRPIAPRASDDVEVPREHDLSV